MRARAHRVRNPKFTSHTRRIWECLPAWCGFHNCSRQPASISCPRGCTGETCGRRITETLGGPCAKPMYSSSSFFISLETRGWKLREIDAIPVHDFQSAVDYFIRNYTVGRCIILGSFWGISFFLSAGTNRISNVELSGTTLFHNDTGISFL